MLVLIMAIRCEGVTGWSPAATEATTRGVPIEEGRFKDLREVNE